jgi:hypothetical protein
MYYCASVTSAFQVFLTMFQAEFSLKGKLCQVFWLGMACDYAIA